MKKTHITFEEKRCGFRFFAKRKIVADNSVLALSSAVFSVLAYYKIKDNIKDERFFKSLGARLILPFASHIRKKAIKRGYSDVERIVCDCMESISELEASKSTCSCEASEAFGDMLGYLLKLGLPDEEKEKAYTVGFRIGCFIYTADALDDLYEDEKKGSFNPYLNEYGNADTALSETKKIRDTLARGTDVAADIIVEKMKSAPRYTREICELVLNILYLGCPSVLDGILCKGNCKKCRRSGEKASEKNNQGEI